MGKTEKFDAHILGGRLKMVDSLKIRVGIPETATYPDGKKVVEIAAYQEFGTDRIPARPFFRSAIKGNQNKWSDDVRKAVNAALDGKITAKMAFEAISMSVAGDIKKSITEWTDPPLKPQTIKKKGFAKPLVDTGTLLSSVSGVVLKK